MDTSADDNTQEQLNSLIERAKARDEGAFADLVVQYGKGIYGYIVGLVQDRDLANDLCQDVFVNAWKAIPRFRGEASFETWLFKIATNAVYGYWRKQHNLPGIEPLDKAYRVANPVRFEERIEKRELIIAVLQEVPETYRPCFLLEIEGKFSRQEISEILGISTSSVSSYICKAREFSRRGYRRLEKESSSAQEKGGKHHER